MGQSKKVRAGTRTYYFDECTDKKGNRFISIAEVPHTPNRHRHRIFVHEEDFEKFAEDQQQYEPDSAKGSCTQFC